MKLIEFDLVDGGAYDCIPQNLVLVESFDTLKNDAFPDAQTFVVYQDEAGSGRLLTNTTLEEVGEAIQDAATNDWFEATTIAENRVLIRRDSVSARRSLDTGSELTLMVGGTTQTLVILESIETIRAAMSAPTYSGDGPPGMQPAPIEPE